MCNIWSPPDPPCICRTPYNIDIDNIVKRLTHSRPCVCVFRRPNAHTVGIRAVRSQTDSNSHPLSMPIGRVHAAAGRLINMSFYIYSCVVPAPIPQPALCMCVLQAECTHSRHSSCSQPARFQFTAFPVYMCPTGRMHTQSAFELFTARPIPILSGCCAAARSEFVCVYVCVCVVVSCVCVCRVVLCALWCCSGYVFVCVTCFSSYTLLYRCPQAECTPQQAGYFNKMSCYIYSCAVEGLSHGLPCKKDQEVTHTRTRTDRDKHPRH